MFKDKTKKLYNLSFNFRLVYKVILVVGFIIVSVVAILNYFFLHKLAEPKIKQAKEVANTTSIIVSQLALSSFYNKGQIHVTTALNEIFKKINNRETNLLQISVILLPTGVYYASTNKEFQNKKAGQTLLRKIKQNKQPGTSVEKLNYEVKDRTIYVLQFLRNINVLQKGDERRMAVTQILFDYGKIINDTRESLLILGVVILLLSVVIIWIIFIPVTSAHKKLIEAMNQISGHNFDFTLHPKANDEIGLLFHTFNRMAAHLRDYLSNRQILPAKLSEDIRGEVKSISKEAMLRKTEITCLCARIPIIQKRIEKDTPDMIAEYISDFLEPFEKTVHLYGGQIIRIIGDKVYTLFEGINSVDNSIRAALKVNQKWQKLNHERKILGREICDYGIGLNSAQGLAGRLSKTLLGYTFFGKAASIAEYLCSCAQREEILISSSMMDQTNGEYQHSLSKDLKPITFSEEDVFFTLANLTENDDTVAFNQNIETGMEELGYQSKNKDGNSTQQGASTTGKIVPHFAEKSPNSSIPEMLEETLNATPLAPLTEAELNDDRQNQTFASNGAQGTERGKSSADKKESLWEKFESRVENAKG